MGLSGTFEEPKVDDGEWLPFGSDGGRTEMGNGSGTVMEIGPIIMVRLENLRWAVTNRNRKTYKCKYTFHYFQFKAK